MFGLLPFAGPLVGGLLNNLFNHNHHHHHGHHHHGHWGHGHGFRIGIIGGGYDGCYVTRRVFTPYGVVLRTVNVCY